MKYYIYRNNSKEGEFTMEELQNMKLYPNDLVWIKNDWTRADYIEELKNHLKEPPPLSPNELKLVRLKALIKKTFLYAISIHVLSALVIGYLIASTAINGYNGGAVYDKNPIYLTSEEHANHGLVYIHNICDMLLWLLPFSILAYILYIFVLQRKKANVYHEELLESNEYKGDTIPSKENKIEVETPDYIILLAIIFITLAVLMVFFMVIDPKMTMGH